jgi:hypothetical protein
MKVRLLASLCVLGVLAGRAWADPWADFDLFPLGPDSHWNGDPGFAAPLGFTANYVVPLGAGSFNTFYTVDAFSGWPFWAGWAYSNESDTTTPGYLNQFSAIPGAAHSGTNYAIGYPDTWYGVTPTVTLAAPAVLDHLYLTNTTYAYLAMRDGYFPAKEFGGDDGTDPDWFKVIITGKDAGGGTTGTIEFYLADFRFADSADDYIVDTWQKVDLGPLGEVQSLAFTLDSSDKTEFYGTWWINTPTYFAMDTVMPEPASLGLAGIGLAAILGRAGARRRARRASARPAAPPLGEHRP